MVLLFQLKEQWRFTTPPITTFRCLEFECYLGFTAPGTWLEVMSNGGEARIYLFTVIDKNWIHGKYLRFLWARCPHWFVNPVWRARIYDGIYDRHSATDFPWRADFPLKGAGLLQTLSDDPPGIAPAGTVIDRKVDVSASTEQYVTLFWWADDPFWGDETQIALDWVEINSGPNGTGRIYRHEFELIDIFFPAPVCIIGEQWGTDYDYSRAWQESDDDIIWGGPPNDLKCGFKVRNCKDFSASLGIAFYWYGSGKDELVDLFLRSPTGTLIASFADGPAAWRWIYIPWSEMVETGIDGSLPDKTMICAILWTLHSPGVRRLDHVVQYFCRDLPGSFWVRHTATPENLKGKLSLRRSTTSNVKGNFVIAHVSYRNLDSKLEIQRDSGLDLKAGFLPRRLQPATSTLRGTFDVGKFAVDLSGKLEIPRGYRWIPSKVFLGEDFAGYTEIDGDVP